MRPIYQLFLKFLHKTSIKIKLLTVTFALIVLPLSVTSIIMFNNTSDMYADSVYNLSNMSLEYIGQVMESKLARALNTADIVASSPEVQKVLSKDVGNYTLEEQLADMKSLSLYLQGFVRDSAIAGVRLSVRDGLIYSNEGQNFININTLADYPGMEAIGSQKVGYPCCWLRNTLRGNENTISGQEVISCVKVIHSISNFDDILGFVFVDISVNTLNLVLSEADITKDAFLCVVDQENTVLAAVGKVNDVNRAIALAVKLPLTNKKTIEISEVSYQVHIKRLTLYNWNIISLVPLEKIQHERNKNAGFTLMLLVMLAGVTLLMGSFIYKITLNRINRIVVSLKKVQEGSLDSELPAVSDDEIGQIEKNYNYMISHIRELIKETYVLVGKARDAELKALQAQINPHFLYNTINTISWTAMDYGADKVCRMLKALSDFYKLSLQPGKQEVTLRDEIRHVELYIEIQNMRYRDAITLAIDVPDEIKASLMPSMILQPLVENSVIHGIMAKRERRGRILLRGVSMEEDIMLSVIDDGVGMKEETLAQVIQCHSPNEDYGIYNIHERILLKYGEKYGLFFESCPECGTRVDIRIPKMVSLER